MTRLRHARLEHHFRLDRDDDLLALPFCHHRGCQRIADYVGGGPPHVKELIDANDQRSPASGKLKLTSVAAMTTSDARGTPAIPLLVTMRRRSIVICCPKPSWMLYACAMNMVAKVQYIIDPSRLNE